MRTLLLFRGSAGVGKSTIIDKYGLNQYTLSSDKIRLLHQAPILTPEGNYCISMSHEKKVWNLLMTLLEKRMQTGEFTVIDATHSNSKDFIRYKYLAKKYRYRILCVDLTDISIDITKKRNKLRENYKIVPEKIIDKMYTRFETQIIPTYVKSIKLEELYDSLHLKPIDLTFFNKISIIGDIHGCFTALNRYFDKNSLNENTLFIFTGDYIDRGIENAETLRLLLNIHDSQNVIMLEGNHERWLWAWANNETAKSLEFENKTKKDLEKYGITKKEVRQFYRKLRQLAYFVYHDKTFIVTHGGLSTLPENLTFIATEQLIKGVGSYEDDIDATFLNTTQKNVYQVHGHRNIQNFSIKVNERCFNLEGKVELGGTLRILEITKNSINGIEIKNEVYNKERFKHTQQSSIIIRDTQAFIQELRNDNSNIYEKKLEGNISSFNFKRKVFYDKLWNEQTIKARGLFINTHSNEIVARSYNKFFNIGERPETRIEALKKNLKFPVKAYLKENGYLGLLGYDRQSDSLMFCSKSTNVSDFAFWFKDILYSSLNLQIENKVKNFLKNSNSAFIFEVIDITNDPHIIKYTHNQAILLDIVYRTSEYKKMSYEDTKKYAEMFGFKCKEEAYVFNNWKEFDEWYTKITDYDWKYKENHVEGFVLEDAEGFMTKVKLPYYSFWKYMRGVKDRIKADGAINLDMLNTELAKNFYLWLKTQNKEILSKGIIELREMYYNNVRNYPKTA